MTASRVLLLCLICWLPGQSLAWWNDAWPYRVPITVDTSASGANVQESADEFTVLVKLHAGNFQDFFLVKEDLSDLRFVDGDDLTPLTFHVESFDLINQLGFVWVKIPKVVGGINTGRIWMYYGNAEAVAATDSGQSFDSNTGLVYHFSNQGMPQDAGAWNNQAASFSGALEQTALIAGGARFAAGTNLIVNDSPSLALQAAKGQTISAWIKPMGVQGDAWLLHRSGGSGELVLGIERSSIYARLQTPSGQVFETPRVAAVGSDTWHHVSLTIAPDAMSIAVDGQQVTSMPIVLEDMVGTWAIGSSLQGENPFVGVVDELRIDSVARSANWLTLVLASQGLDSRLLKIQQAEQLGSGGGGSGFWAIIIGSMEESGWTIVSLLLVMAAVSWLVMVGKWLYIRRVNQDNHGFLDEYRKLGNRDPAMLDHSDSDEDQALDDAPIVQAIFGSHDHYQSSPIYRVYHRGIQEAQSRLGRSASAQAAGLSRPAIEAIRAALDAQMVREAQRLNAKMVLLTIAISGGPFLGLLGTVVGVMITFAAIAATGDVNISAIAPGVAAALLTTVAGLFVAIPALFGYNYLATQIKEAIADMRVFTDEFITRMAEYYGR